MTTSTTTRPAAVAAPTHNKAYSALIGVTALLVLLQGVWAGIFLQHDGQRDAAHIVPPTGAKGLNLAVADVRLLDLALGELFATGSEGLIDAYSDTALRRVWRTTHFSWWMTSMLHSFGDEFDDELRIAQLRYVTSSDAAAAGLAENYTGLPLGT